MSDDKVIRVIPLYPPPNTAALIGTISTSAAAIISMFSPDVTASIKDVPRPLLSFSNFPVRRDDNLFITACVLASDGLNAAPITVLKSCNAFTPPVVIKSFIMSCNSSVVISRVLSVPTLP